MTTLTGFGRLVRLIIRRDRSRLAIWIVAVAGITLASAGGLPAVYPNQRAVDNYVALFGDNPSLVAFAGPGYGFEDPNIGLVLVNETQMNGMIALALMSIFLVNRNTRAEEDTERAELIRSSVVGRHAPTSAAVAVIGGANLVAGLLCAIGFIAFGYQATGSIALAASMALVGLLFAGVAAVAAQVASTGRATLGLSSAVLGIAFVVRAVGDIADNGVSWLSPIGWAQAVRAYADERWWALGLCVVATAALMGGAFWLSTRRDLGSGLVPPRPGRPEAPAWMRRPLGLAFRLQRGAMVGWTVSLFLMGYIYGSIAQDIEKMLEENDVMADMFASLGGADPTDSFFAVSIIQLGLLAAASAIASTLRLSTEESAGRAEPILATATGRVRWSLSHLSIAVGGTIVTVGTAGLGLGVAYAVIAKDVTQVPRLLVAALVVVPAVLVLVGITVLLFGAVPSAARMGWAALGVTVVVSLFGELLRLPSWIRSVSPFEHVPAVPAEPLAMVPVVALSLLAVGLIGAGLWSFGTRDLRTD